MPCSYVPKDATSTASSLHNSTQENVVGKIVFAIRLDRFPAKAISLQSQSNGNGAAEATGQFELCRVPFDHRTQIAVFQFCEIPPACRILAGYFVAALFELQINGSTGNVFERLVTISGWQLIPTGCINRPLPFALETGAALREGIHAANQSDDKQQS